MVKQETMKVVDGERLLDFGEVALALGVSIRTVRRWTKRKERPLQTVRINRQTRYVLARDLLAFLHS